MTMRFNQLRNFALTLLLLPVCGPRQAAAYSLLTHEELIDLTWNDSIVPLLKSQYPNLTPAELDRARSFAYGGCVIQDMGYYPFGDGFFSDLTHYVRIGDFIVALLRNAHNANELAFAVGALVALHRRFHWALARQPTARLRFSSPSWRRATGQA